MKVFILANGEGTRWNNYKGVPKQLLKIDDETLLDRMIRLVRKNGINDITICGNFKRKGCKTVYTKAKTKRELFIEIAELSKEPFIMLNGDCYYTDAIIKDCINRDVKKWGHWCRLNANPHTGKPWGEGYIHRVEDLEWWITNLKKLCEKCNTGEIEIKNDWSINRYLAGWQDIYTHREDLPNQYDILWDDETDDFDFSCGEYHNGFNNDYERFIHFTGHKGM